MSGTNSNKACVKIVEYHHEQWMWLRVNNLIEYDSMTKIEKKQETFKIMQVNIIISIKL